MKTIGFQITKGKLNFTVLEGTKSSPTLLDKGRLITIDPSNVPALMDWFESQFLALLDKHSPKRIAFRLTLEPDKEQLFTSEFPYGVLNLLAYKKSIPIASYTPQAFVPSKLNLPKETDLLSLCDEVFGKHPRVRSMQCA